MCDVCLQIVTLIKLYKVKYGLIKAKAGAGIQRGLKAKESMKPKNIKAAILKRDDTVGGTCKACLSDEESTPSNWAVRCTLATSERYAAAGGVTVNKEEISHNEPKEVRLTSKVLFCADAESSDELIQGKKKMAKSVDNVSRPGEEVCKITDV